MRARFLDCADGTFSQRDPIGIWGDMLNRGGPKAYCAGNPINWSDRLGRDVHKREYPVGSAQCGAHIGSVVTQGSNKPGEGEETGYDGMPDGEAVSVQKNKPSTEGETFERVRPPDHADPSEWDEAWKEAGEEVAGELGERGISTKPGTAPKAFPKSAGGHIGARFVPRQWRNAWDCWDVYDEIYWRAVSKVAGKPKTIKRRWEYRQTDTRGYGARGV